MFHSPLLRKLCPLFAVLVRMRAGLILNLVLRSVPTASNLPSPLARPVFGPESGGRPDGKSACFASQPQKSSFFCTARMDPASEKLASEPKKASGTARCFSLHCLRAPGS